MSRARPRVPAFAKHIATVFALFMIGCSSGAGCSSCGGITPLPGGFEASKKIENAGSARLTQGGLQFLQDNLGILAGNLFGASNGVLSFPINTTTGSIIGTNYTICPNGPTATDCTVLIDFAHSNLTISVDNPHEIKISGPLKVHLNLPVHALGCDLDATLTGNNDCPSTDNSNQATLNLNVDISIEADQNTDHARYGYTRIRIATIDVPSNDIDDSLDTCSVDGNPLCSLETGFLNAIKGFLIDALHGQIDDILKSQIESQLCQKANPDVSPSCPTGTNEVSGICRYGSDASAECVSMMLGTDGHANLGGLLASLSPGTKGGLDFLFAAGGTSPSTMAPQLSWGDLEPNNFGATIGMYGGAEANPVSKCVKLSQLPLPTMIPIPDELFQNTIPGWPAAIPGPHLGIALSERFANYAMSSAYNSGLLCIGVSTESVPLLNSGTIGLLMPSSKDLAIQHEAQQIGLVVRPSSPPKITFGNGTNLTNDPLIRVKLDQASFDFYVFSVDRFIRFMTATYDLDVPVNLTVSQDGLTPVLDKIGVTNGKVTNNALLTEDPKQIADALAGLIEGQVGQAVGGGIAPIDLNSALSSLGLSLVIPDTVKGQGSPGLRKLTKNTDNYLGIFASFEVGGMMNVHTQLPVETSGAVVRKDVDPKGLRFATVDAKNGPVVRVSFASPEDGAGSAIEYSYKVDQGFWHPFSSERLVDVSDPYLRVQGKHVISVRGRVAGAPKTTDPTPAEIPVIIDVDPPVVSVGQVSDDGKAEVVVKDLVSDLDHEVVRVRLDGGDWSSWQPARDLRFVVVGAAKNLEVEAKDEEGNLGTARQALLRGRSTSGAAGCGCEVAGGDDGPRGAPWLVAMALGGLAARFARARARARKAKASVARGAGAAVALGAAFSWAGCSCGDDSSNSTSGGDCSPPDCQSLKPGLIGEYTSVAVAGSSIWVAGYAEANWDQGYTWGDLFVGKWTGKKVDWEPVNGVPDDPKVDPTKFDVGGFRGGQNSPGDDVGSWTSIAVDASGSPAVAYYDRTNKSLKFAQHMGGKSWAVSTVDGKAGADVGRYAKLLFANGLWVIGYQSIEPGGDAGAALGRVRLATSIGTKPGDGESILEDVAVDKQTPCRAQYCSGGQVCVASTKRCTMPAADNACNPACASGESCISAPGGGSCQALFDSNKIDTYPDAIGGYISIAPNSTGGVGVAYYDRPRGNLMVANKDGTAWKSVLVDGEADDGTDTGDSGVGTCLQIDSAGAWNITYVDGITEALKFVKLDAQLKTIGGPEIIDDGQVLNGVQNLDGQHLVGDDSSLLVTPSGELHVSYQDATSGKLRYAIGSPTGTTHKWTVQDIAQDGFAGAFSHVIQVNGSIQLVNWWRKGGPAVGDVAILKP